MTERSGPGVAAAGGKDRFDGETVRRILQRAAVEQHRLNNELADSYSLEELEEMAAEARISPEALRNAIEAREPPPSAAARTAAAQALRPRRWFMALERSMPGRSPAIRRAVLAGTGSIAVVGALLAFPAIAEALLWGTLLALIVLSVLILLGASPL